MAEDLEYRNELRGNLPQRRKMDRGPTYIPLEIATDTPGACRGCQTALRFKRGRIAWGTPAMWRYGRRRHTSKGDRPAIQPWRPFEVPGKPDVKADGDGPLRMPR